jgi:SAM-dependent MidA family methyltransferase
MQLEQHQGLELPAADQESATHSRRVAEFIAQRIAEQGGSISFAEFMQHALYAPGLGYYVSGTSKFGAGGDFITAPEISPLFGHILARQAAAVLDTLGRGEILELGAGSGVLAEAMLTKLAMLNALPERYYILEVSADLQQRQREHLEREVPDLVSRVQWLSQLPEDFSGTIIANEVADSLPVERFTKTGGLPKQLRVVAAKDGFDWFLDDPPDLLGNAIERIEREIGWQIPDDYRSEICLALPPWVSDLTACLHEGIILLFDYGVSRREYYAPDRSDGWLRCHFRHHAHSNPLVLPGIQDLTAWVDFSALAGAAVDGGATIAGFVSQAHFLINGGLQEELADFTSLPVEEQLELSRQTKLLTLPGEMGENFKCMGISCGDIAPPAALSDFDRTHML